MALIILAVLGVPLWIVFGVLATVLVLIVRSGLALVRSQLLPVADLAGEAVYAELDGQRYGDA